MERRIAAMDGPIIAQAPPLKMKMVLYIRLLLTRWQCVRCFVAILFSEMRGAPWWKSYTRNSHSSSVYELRRRHLGLPSSHFFGSDEWRSKLDIS